MKDSRIAAFLAGALIADVAVAADTEPTRLSRVFDPEMIGADIAYFEQVSGIARNTYTKAKIYKVDDCELTVAIAAGVVRSIRMRLDSHCTFDLNRYFPNQSGRFPPPHAMTFGGIDRITDSDGRFYSDCLVDCGNAYDPSTYEHWTGPRADNSFEVLFEAVHESGAGLDAANAWHAEMESIEGRDWVLDAKFNCSDKYDANAHRAYRDVKVTAITIGRDLELPGCES